MRNNTKKIALTAMFAALAMALSLLESIVTAGMDFAIPGVKLGLANAAVLFALMYVGGGFAVFVALVKAFSTFLLSGSVTVLWFSLAGSLVSVLGMWAAHRFLKRFLSPVGVSILGGVLHNWTQAAVMILISSTPSYLYYVPVLTLSGIASGIITGVVAALVLEKFKPAGHPKMKET